MSGEINYRGKVRSTLLITVLAPGDTQHGKVENSAQHSVHPTPDKVRWDHGGGSRRMPCGQSGSFRGLRLVPAKQRFLVPTTSGYPHPHQGAAQGCYANASRWAAQLKPRTGKG